MPRLTSYKIGQISLLTRPFSQVTESEKSGQAYRVYTVPAYILHRTGYTISAQ